MKNGMEFHAATSMLTIISKCFEVGILAILLLTLGATLTENYILIKFLLVNVGSSLALVCLPLMGICAIVKRINK